MKQYTTPVIQWIFKYINLSTIEQIRVIIKDETNHTIKIADPEIRENVVQVRLTQEQTVSLKKGKVRMQLHWKQIIHGHGVPAGRKRSGITG